MEYTFGNRHENCKHVQTMNRVSYSENTDLGKALFYAIKAQNWKQAFYLMDQGAPICKIYQYQQDQYLSTVSLLVKIISEARVKHDYRMLTYKFPDRLLDQFITLGIDLECRCTRKFAHRCPLFVALKNLKIKTEQELFLPQNQLVRKLIIAGATIKKHWDDERNYNIPWFDVQQVKNYLISLDNKKKEDKQNRQNQIKEQSQALLENDQSIKYNKSVVQNISEQQQQQENQDNMQKTAENFNKALQQAASQNNTFYNINSNGGTVTSFKKLRSEFHD